MSPAVRRLLIACALALVPVGAPSSAQPEPTKPPPVVAPTPSAPTPGPPSSSSAPKPAPAPGAPNPALGPPSSSSAGAPQALDCDTELEMVLAELDYYRDALAASPPPAKTPGSDEPQLVADAKTPANPATTTAAPTDRPRIQQVASAVKEMKPRQAAEVLAGFDEPLATEVLAQMPARSAGAIAAALPPELAARLLARLSLLAVPKDKP